jgi:hypothetical protein
LDANIRPRSFFILFYLIHFITFPMEEAQLGLQLLVLLANGFQPLFGLQWTISANIFLCTFLCFSWFRS